MRFLKRALATLPLVINLLPAAAYAGQSDCGSFDTGSKIALGRIESQDAKVNFVAGPSKTVPACPSPESACKLKAFVVPGDEVLLKVGGRSLCLCDVQEFARGGNDGVAASARDPGGGGRDYGRRKMGRKMVARRGGRDCSQIHGKYREDFRQRDFWCRRSRTRQARRGECRRTQR